MRFENLILDTIKDRLAEGQFIAWKLGKPRLHSGDEILFGSSRGPGIVGMEYDERFHVRRRVGIGTVIIPAHMVYNGCNLRKFQDGLAQSSIHLARLPK